MTTRQRNRSAAEVDEQPAPDTDDAPAFTGTVEVWESANHTIPDLLPQVGDWVRYQVRMGRTIPMLVTDVFSPSVIDGVAFSARPSDVGNSYGSRGYQRIRRGEGDGQWLM